MHGPSLSLLIAVFLRSALVLVFLVAGLRLLGKRQMAQVHVYDLAMITALANSVQNAMTQAKGELAVGLVSAGTLMGVGWLLTYVFLRIPSMEERVVGDPTVLVNQGQVVEESLRREHVTRDQLFAALRDNGLATPDQARLVVLEVDGSLSVVPREEQHQAKEEEGSVGSDQEAQTDPEP